MTDEPSRMPLLLTLFFARGSGGCRRRPRILRPRTRRSRRSSGRLRGRGIQPTGMHPGIETWGRFGVDIVALTDHAAERCLDVGARAAKAVVKVKVAKRG